MGCKEMWKYGIYKDMIIFYWPLKQSSGRILNVESVYFFWIRTQMLPYDFYEEFMLPNSQFGISNMGKGRMAISPNLLVGKKCKNIIT